MRGIDDGRVFEDDNDVDEFGMDARTRKRLRVKKKVGARGMKRPERPMRTKLPYSLARIPKIGEDDMADVALRNRNYIQESAPGGTGWTKIGHGGHPNSLMEKAISNYNKQVAMSFVKLLDKRFYDETLGKNYMGNGYVLLVGKGVNKSDLSLNWELYVDHHGGEVRIILKYRTPQMSRQSVHQDSVDGRSDPTPVLKRFASYLAGSD